MVEPDDIGGENCHFTLLSLLFEHFGNVVTFSQVGYIVMLDPSTGLRTNLLRMRDAAVVGVYHPLIDEKLVQVLHR